MKCPACKQPLVVVERESIEVDWCPACRGVWFDVGELELLAEKAGRELPPQALGREPVVPIDEAPRRCPRCRRKMAKAECDGEPAVIIDRCADHGVWLDAGELGALMRGLEGSEGAASAAPVVAFLGETFSHPSARQGAETSSPRR